MKDIYIVHVGNYIGAYRFGKCPTIAYASAEKFIDFIQSLREDYPEYRLRCVRNWGIEEEVRKIIAVDEQDKSTAVNMNNLITSMIINKKQKM